MTRNIIDTTPEIEDIEQKVFEIVETKTETKTSTTVETLNIASLRTQIVTLESNKAAKSSEYDSQIAEIQSKIDELIGE